MVTHADLVAIAAKWLSSRCPVVITEMTSGAWEQPDAIGWRGGRSILVECKASREDLRKDADKPHRRRESIDADGRQWAGLGDERYYLFPVGLVEPDSPLIPPGWGVLYASAEGKVRSARAAEYRRGDWDAERSLLISCIRRLGVRSEVGIGVKIYTVQNKCRATVTLDLERTDP